LDSRKNGELLKVRLLRTYSDGKFVEEEWTKPEPADTEIEVKAVMTGVCRSDIDMMTGKFPTLPAHMSGHEGLGIVTKVGGQILNVKEGDYVATRGEPAYADYYNVRAREFIVVPGAEPKYILEPVACGINIVKQNSTLLQSKVLQLSKCLIIGSGFLAWVAYNTLKLDYYKFGTIEVWGNSNHELWANENVLVQEPSYEKYDVIIDIREHIEVLKRKLLAPQGVWIIAAEKESFTTTFSELLWNANTIAMPSPRHDGFYNAMYEAELWVKTNNLKVDTFWTKCYNRNTEWQQAFEDGLNRPQGYSRGYIKWD
jgi:D-arabinose 1-dehydrogenase-like Zn-dependent alcohol dehydrogenase